MKIIIEVEDDLNLVDIEKIYLEKCVQKLGFRVEGVTEE